MIYVHILFIYIKQKVCEMTFISKLCKKMCVQRCCYANESDYLIQKMLTFNSKDECSLCLDTYDSAECISMISCKHIFHKSCIMSYMEYNKINRDKLVCPYCQTIQQY